MVKRVGGWARSVRCELLLYINMQRFRGGLVSKDHRLVYHSTLGLRVIKKKKDYANAPLLLAQTIRVVIFVTQKQFGVALLRD